MAPVYTFGPFRLSPSERALYKNGVPIPLTPKAFDTLVALVESHGRLIDKDTLMKRLWPDTFVEESTLSQNVFTLRKALGESNGGRYIETVPKHGYRFVAAVNEVMASEAPGVVTGSERRARSRWPGIVAVVSLVALVGVIVAAVMQRQKTPAVTQRSLAARSLAVLPFRSLSNDSNDNYLGLAMADALITRLGNMRRIVVRPTSAIRGYSSSTEPATKAARELGVESVLEGNIQRDGDRIRVSVQLLDARDGSPLWGEKFDVAHTDMFAVQDRVADQVAQALIAGLDGTAVRIERRTNKPGAYEAYLKGRYFWNKRTEDGFRRAIAEFERAIKQDPNFAKPYSGLADAYALLGSMPNRDTPRSVAMPKAKQYAHRAIALDDTLAEGHTSLAFVHMHHEYDWKNAEREFNRAIELDPGYATTHHWRAYYLLAMNRSVEALASMRRAEQLDPLSPIISTDVAEMLYFAGRHDEALAQLENTLALDPHYPLALRIRAHTLFAKGDRKGALAHLQRAVDEGRPDTLLHIAGTLAYIGERDRARVLLERFLKRGEKNVSIELAGIYMNLGNKDRAIELLELAYSERSGGLILLNHLGFEPLHTDPRYVSLVHRLGLPMPQRVVSRVIAAPSDRSDSRLARRGAERP